MMETGIGRPRKNFIPKSKPYYPRTARSRKLAMLTHISQIAHFWRTFLTRATKDDGDRYWKSEEEFHSEIQAIVTKYRSFT